MHRLPPAARASSELILQTGEDSDGLTHEQVLVELQRLNPSITEEQATAWIAQVDEDADGSIQIDEFLLLMRLAESEGALPQNTTAGMKKRRNSLPRNRRDSYRAYSALSGPDCKEPDVLDEALNNELAKRNAESGAEWLCGYGPSTA